MVAKISAYESKKRTNRFLILWKNIKNYNILDLVAIYSIMSYSALPIATWLQYDILQIEEKLVMIVCNHWYDLYWHWNDTHILRNMKILCCIITGRFGRIFYFWQWWIQFGKPSSLRNVLWIISGQGVHNFDRGNFLLRIGYNFITIKMIHIYDKKLV